MHAIRLDGRKASLLSRNGKSQDFQFPDIMAELKRCAKEREDENAKDVHRESSTKEKTVEQSKSQERVIPISSKLFEFTNTERIMFPVLGVTKGEVIEYYERIASHLLPYLKDRPVTVERMPGGVGEGKVRFWQKNTPFHYPDWIPRVNLPSEEGKAVHYALINDARTLLYFVNQGALTFHVWLSRVDDLNCPDLVLFDLDPGKASFKDVVTVAQHLHDVFKELKIEATLKTSGKTGLHILVPWPPTRKIVGDYDDARAWALGIAKRAVAECPEIATIERSKAKRQGKVYIDVIQNARGHHAVPPYVLRGVPEATVSTPLDWNELNEKLDPKQFNIRTIFTRLGLKRPKLKEVA